MAKDKPGREISIEAIRERYRDLIGFIPPRAAARLRWMEKHDPEFLLKVEEARFDGMCSGVFDQATTQLILVGILLGQASEAAKWHIIAARRAGASWEQLDAVARLAYLFRGLPALNLAGKLFEEVQEIERTGGEPEGSDAG